MLGEIVELKEDVLMCMGQEPDNIIFHPVICNCYCIREHDTVYIIDTGAGPVIRKSLKQAVERLRKGTDKLVLINTHIHADHVGNNDILSEFKGFSEVRHLVHEAGKVSSDPYQYFLQIHERIDRYYDVFEGPPPPWRTFMRFLEFGNRSAALKNMVKWGMRKFEPMKPSLDTAVFLSDSEMETLELKTLTVNSVATDQEVTIHLEPLKLKGWKVNGAFIINDGAHSSDHVIVFFPEKKILVTGDLTLELFPTWPGESSGEKNLEGLNLCLEMVVDGLVTMLLDSHHNPPLVNRVEITKFLKSIIISYRDFKKTLFSLMRTGEKYSVQELYRQMRKMRFENKTVDSLLDMQFPKTPVFLKTIIANILVEEGCTIEGTGKTAVFTLPG